jgi:hypothetical protein
MRAMCYLSGGCNFLTIREEWLPADKTHQTVRLLRFGECPHCHDTVSTITSPEPGETRNTMPARWTDNGVVQDEPRTKLA